MQVWCNAVGPPNNANRLFFLFEVMKTDTKKKYPNTYKPLMSRGTVFMGKFLLNIKPSRIHFASIPSFLDSYTILVI